jgi:hypothetical protein
MVIADPVMRDQLCWTDYAPTDNKGVFINLELGCCGYVKQESKEAKESI